MQYSNQRQRLRQSQGARGGPTPATFSDQVSALHCCANTSNSTAHKGLLTAQAFFQRPCFRGKLVQAAGFWYALCKGSCWLHTVLLQKLDTTDDSCLVLSRKLTNIRCWFLCLLRAAQLPSQGCVFNLAFTDQLRGGEPAHRKVCCLACCACSHRRNNTALRSQYCRNLQTWGPGTLFMA